MLTLSHVSAHFSSQPIGLFDSGVGGLSVFSKVRELLPHEDLIYIADSAYLPYGEKQHEQVKERAILATQRLVDMGAKAIVVACNTATAASVVILRERFKLPIIGMEPGLKPGVELSKNGKIAILATEGTLISDKFRTLMKRHANGMDIRVQPCHGWVELVEQQRMRDQTGKRLIAEAIEPLIAQGVDTLVLGCTHYPFLKDVIEETLDGRQVHLVDTGLAVAQQLRRRLVDQGLLNNNGRQGEAVFYSGTPGGQADEIFSSLLGHPCRVKPFTA